MGQKEKLIQRLKKRAPGISPLKKLKRCFASWAIPVLTRAAPAVPGSLYPEGSPPLLLHKPHPPQGTACLPGQAASETLEQEGLL